MIRRLFQTQEKKVDLMLSTLEQIAHIFNAYVYELSTDIKEEYIAIASKFIKEDEGYGEIQENEQN